MRGIHKRHIIIFGLIGAVIFVLLFRAVNSYYEFLTLKQPPIYGVTFTPRYAKYLGLDPKVTYQQLLEMGVRRVRLSAYWNEDPQEIDYYIQEAQKHQASVILGIGYKLPRWPECFGPSSFTEAELEKHLGEIIGRYEDNPTIVAWQVENEFGFPFGECPVKRTQEDFLAEITFVRDHSRKHIVLTDTGEYGAWRFAMQHSDIFGTTLYREAHYPLLGRIYYPLQPWYYRLKSELLRRFVAPDNLKTIIIELQAESWLANGAVDTPLEEQIALMPPEQILKNAEYARLTGADEIYLWGAEWWYYLAAHGHPEYVSEVSKLFQR